jgi:hypothetical protein
LVVLDDLRSDTLQNRYCTIGRAQIDAEVYRSARHV